MKNNGKLNYILSTSIWNIFSNKLLFNCYWQINQWWDFRSGNRSENRI